MLDLALGQKATFLLCGHYCLNLFLQLTTHMLNRLCRDTNMFSNLLSAGLTTPHLQLQMTACGLFMAKVTMYSHWVMINKVAPTSQFLVENNQAIYSKSSAYLLPKSCYSYVACI